MEIAGGQKVARGRRLVGEIVQVALLAFGVLPGATLVGISHAQFPLPRLPSFGISGRLHTTAEGTLAGSCPCCLGSEDRLAAGYVPSG